MRDAASLESASSVPPITRASIVVDGRRVGPYELRYELASGGMATVYLARAPGIGGMPPRAVALKCIHPHLARQPELIEMFVDEARIAARIQHPHVCSVLDFGEAEGTPYLAMDFLRGASLASLMRMLGPGSSGGPGARLPVQSLIARVVRVIGDACEGLHAAHELEVVHRDVTPGNLFLGSDGLLRVVDFGIARAEGRIHRTATGQLKGTLAYMAPESVSDEHVDRRADVWSVGVVAWELLTGQRLFRREGELETLRAVGHDPIVPPSRVRPGIPPAIDAVILRALARDRGARWSTARELGHALHRAAGTSGVAHAADLAEWLEQLFPERRAQQEELVRATLAPRPSDDERTPSGVSNERVTAPAIALPPSTSRPTALAGPALQPRGHEEATRAARSQPMSATRPASRVARAVLPLATGLAGLALGALLFAWRADDPPPAAPAHASALPATDGQPSTAPRDLDPPREPAPDPAPDDDLVEAAPALDDAPNLAPDDARPRAIRRAGRGFANVSSRGGWADIYHRGRFVGRTPLRLELPAGRQVLQLHPFGRGPERRLVVVVPVEGDTTASLDLR